MPGPSADTARRRREARREQLHELSRLELLDAAESVFGDKGIHAATIKEIAELAGYAVGSVYTFFDGKDALVHAVFARRGDEMLDGIRRLTAPGGPALDRIVALARFEVAFFRERPAFARMYLGSAAIGDLLPLVERDHELLHNFHDVMGRTAALFAEGQAAGDVCEGAPLLLARLLSGIVTSYQAAQDDLPQAAMADEQFDALVRRTFGASALVPTSTDPTTRAKGPA